LGKKSIGYGSPRIEKSLENLKASPWILLLCDFNLGRFKFFCLLLFEAAFTSFFKDKKSKRSHRTVGIKVHLTIFA
jgi:hypothetical protein